jgi:hypothetical protein
MQTNKKTSEAAEIHIYFSPMLNFEIHTAFQPRVSPLAEIFE